MAARSDGAHAIGGLPLAFAQPLMLIGLVSLPVLWWLLRVMPPRPRRIDFPPTRLLFRSRRGGNPGAHATAAAPPTARPAAASAIFAAAGPIYNPVTGAARSDAPLVLPDPRWLERGVKLGHPHQDRRRSDRHGQTDGRGVALIPCSSRARIWTLMPAGNARVALRQLSPSLMPSSGWRCCRSSAAS